MDTELYLTAGQHQVLQEALFGRTPREGAAFLLAGVSRGKTTVRVTAHECWGIGDEGFRDASAGHVELRPATLIDAVNRAVETGCTLIEAHSHPGAAVPRFSAVDERGLSEIVPYMLENLPTRTYGATVWGREGFEGRIWRGVGARFAPVSTLRIVGQAHEPGELGSVDSSPPTNPLGSNRADRLDRAIGARARVRIGQTRFAVVGLGGLGANLLASLLSIGARRFILVDPDLLKEENVDRIPYATAKDARKGLRKVKLAERYVKSRVPAAEVVAVGGGVQSAEAISALKDADILLGAVDAYFPRLVLTRFAAAYLIPFLDSGTGVHVKNEVVTDMGGRVTVLLPGERCLACAGRIHARELAYELAGNDERALALGRGYVTGLDVPQPMIATLNGAVANLAATEALGLVTGVKRPAEQLYYDALSGTVSEVQFADREHCRICQGLLGLADGADLGCGGQPDSPSR